MNNKKKMDISLRNPYDSFAGQTEMITLLERFVAEMADVSLQGLEERINIEGSTVVIVTASRVVGNAVIGLNLKDVHKMMPKQIQHVMSERPYAGMAGIRFLWKWKDTPKLVEAMNEHVKAVEEMLKSPDELDGDLTGSR